MRWLREPPEIELAGGEYQKSDPRITRILANREQKIRGNSRRFADKKKQKKGKIMAELIHKKEVYAIVGAAMAVHNELRSGFAEIVYQEAMELELALRGVPFQRQVRLKIRYKGRELPSVFVADLVCFGTVIVELKAQRSLEGYEEAQIINYLRAIGIRVGILINFGDPARLDWHRYVV